MRPCLFLDRDGVIIHNVPYAKDDSSVALVPGIAELVRSAQLREFLVVVITNQSGIGRGWVLEEAYQAINNKMNNLLKVEGCLPFDAIYFSPYFEKAVDPRWLQKPDWRKPETGMILQACLDFQIDLTKSLVLGDRSSDIEVGYRAGVKYRYLILSQEFSNEILKIPADIEFSTILNPTEVKLDGY
jgi:D-glycero-D-manno-heptose 1,7-bisphosphate phosphatase